MDERKNPEYWAQSINEVGIDEIEELLSNDRSLPGADIDSARQKAIDSYRRQKLLDKFKTQPYRIGLVVVAITSILSVYLVAT